MVPRQPLTCHDVISHPWLFLAVLRGVSCWLSLSLREVLSHLTLPFSSCWLPGYIFIIAVSSWSSSVASLSPLAFGTFFIQMDTSAQLSSLLKCLFMCLQLSQRWRCLLWSWWDLFSLAQWVSWSSLGQGSSSGQQCTCSAYADSVLSRPLCSKSNLVISPIAYQTQVCTIRRAKSCLESPSHWLLCWLLALCLGKHTFPHTIVESVSTEIVFAFCFICFAYLFASFLFDLRNAAYLLPMFIGFSHSTDLLTCLSENFLTSIRVLFPQLLLLAYKFPPTLPPP